MQFNNQKSAKQAKNVQGNEAKMQNRIQKLEDGAGTLDTQYIHKNMTRGNELSK